PVPPVCSRRVGPTACRVAKAAHRTGRACGERRSAAGEAGEVCLAGVGAREGLHFPSRCAIVRGAHAASRHPPGGCIMHRLLPLLFLPLLCLCPACPHTLQSPTPAALMPLA